MRIHPGLLRWRTVHYIIWEQSTQIAFFQIQGNARHLQHLILSNIPACQWSGFCKPGMRSAGYKYQLQSTNPAIVEPPKHDREAIIDHREHKSPDKAKPGLSRKHVPMLADGAPVHSSGSRCYAGATLRFLKLSRSAAPDRSGPTTPLSNRLPQKSTQTDADKEKDILFATDKDPKMKDLREQYQRLHSDFKNKVTEVASVRVDLEKTKKELDAITILHHELEAIHQKTLDENTALMAEKNQMQELKDKMNDLEQQANVAKQMYKTGQEEMEEMRLLIEEQATQLDDYRNKYMKTLQIAEELKKENEFKERECADQIAVEIQKVKLEMQEQLEELSPIKDLLRITQQKLKETEQMHNIALETIADITKKLENANNEVRSCRMWHHAACANISDKTLKKLTKAEVDNWSCSNCINAFKSPNKNSLTNQYVLKIDSPSQLQSQLNPPLNNNKDTIEDKIQNIENIDDMDLETSLNLATEAGNVLVQENAKLKEELSFLQEKVLRIEGLLSSGEEVIEELEAKAERFRNRMEELQQQVGDLQAQLNRENNMTLEFKKLYEDSDSEQTHLINDQHEKIAKLENIILVLESTLETQKESVCKVSTCDAITQTKQLAEKNPSASETVLTPHT
ncbi:hypothetical protein J6590_058072 [Homalodisca vitripennis]|nr:hypothetical protein J6590_058072 [Homalodisca vitripennis]